MACTVIDLPDSTAPSTEALVEGARRAQPEAMSELFVRYRSAAVAVARRHLSCRHDIDDAVAEGFTRAFERLTTLRRAECFRAFVCACVRNVARDRNRSRCREEVLGEIPAPAIPPDTVFELAADRTWLISAVNDLPSRQRWALVRAFWDDAPVAAIAADLGLSDNAAAQLLFRARVGLRARSGRPCRQPRRPVPPVR